MPDSAALDTDSPDFRTIEVHRLAGALGAEVSGVNLAEPLSDETFEELHRAFLENQVIYFRDQDLTPEQYVAFANRWGDIHLHPFNKPMDGHPEIIEMTKRETDTFAHGARWHSDQMYTPQPAMATMLYGREIPPAGGDTMFSNLYLGYEALSDGMKEMLGKLKAVNNGDSKKHPTGTTRAERAAAGTGQIAQKDPSEINIQTITNHPIIRTHPETGRKAIYVGSHTERFDGMTDEESDPIIKYLMEHTHRPEFTCRMRWDVGTLVFWDNRCCQHCAINDYNGQRRRVQKITISGDAPF
jgi:alpha-ketoglutarate-dependent taurine dioxygenase